MISFLIFFDYPMLTSEAGVYMNRKAELEAQGGHVLHGVQHAVGILRGRGHQGDSVPVTQRAMFQWTVIELGMAQRTMLK